MIEYLKYYLTSMYAKGYAMLALWLTIFRELFAKYIFNDWQFFGFLFVLMTADTFFAMMKVIRTDGWRSLSFAKVDRFWIKGLLYFGVLVLAHILGNFLIHGKPFSYFTWVEYFLCSYMIAREGFSVAKNINSISPGTVPIWLIERLDKFQKTGNVKDLTKDDTPEPSQDNQNQTS